MAPSSSDLPGLITGLKVGSTANLEVFRKGSTKKLSVKIGELQEEQERLAKTSFKEETNKLGLSLRMLTDDEQRQAQTEGRLLVEDVSGPAALAGVQPGDVILGVNGNPVKSLADLKNATDKARKTVALLVERDNAQIYIPIRIG